MLKMTLIFSCELDKWLKIEKTRENGWKCIILKFKISFYWKLLCCTLPEDFCKSLIIRHLYIYPFCEYINALSPELNKDFSGIF